MYTIEEVSLNRSRARGQEHSFYFMVRHIPEPKGPFPHRNFHSSLRNSDWQAAAIYPSPLLKFLLIKLSHGFTMLCMSLWEIPWSDVFMFEPLVHQVFHLFVFSFFFFFLMDLEATTEKKYVIESKNYFPSGEPGHPISSLQVTVHSFSLSHTHKVIHSPWIGEQTNQLLLGKLDLTYVGF